MSNENATSKPWSGRFTESTDALVETFSASVDYDRRLYRQDIQGSVAHATMLAAVGVLTDEERDAIVSGLEAIGEQIERGEFTWSQQLEDVHMNIETALTERIGSVGKKLHTARSRNDQVATDLRLYLRGESEALTKALQALQGALLDIAEHEADTIMPGFTHLQTAQPITFGHHMMAWWEMLDRDRERLDDARRRANRSPLGSAALGGTTHPIDRNMTARLLGFDALCENSLDAVSDRDFAIELTATCALLMVHLSRMSEELVLWCSAQFGFVELGDGFCTGSSIMPQKKNPDVPELVRGKTGRVVGHLMALLTLMKGQPLAYNRDNQEDKEPVFDTIDTVRICLEVYARMLPTLRTNRERMREAATRGYSTATELADYLVRRGIPFRDAHEVVGRAVRLGIGTERDLSEISLEEMRQLCPVIEEDVYEVLRLEDAVAARDHIGGTAPDRVRAAVARARSDRSSSPA